MPELPEVETIRVGLSKIIPGKKIIKVTSNWPKSFPSAAADVGQFLKGAAVTRIKRRGKVLILALDSKYALIIHLKMTGQLVYRGKDFVFGAGHPTGSLIGDLPDKSTRVIFDFADGGRLFFNDQRKFGWIKLLPAAEIANIDFFKNYGPEPLGAGFTQADFVRRVRRRLNTNIKAALLDQTVVAGIGNIYADEGLWGAKIHPASIVKNLSDKRLYALHHSLRTVLQLAIEKGGSTDRNYVNAEGQKGSYLEFAKVFRREGKPCLRCGTAVEKLRVAGRGTHICPQCQKF